MPRRPLTDLLTTAVSVAACTAAYYLLPLDELDAVTAVGAVTVFAVGLLVVSGLILLQVSRFRRGERHVGSSVAGVVASLYLAVLFFAAVYYGFAHHAPGSVPGLRTRTDALYFSLTVTSTTGLGDIHAQSQAARAIASVQIAFTIGYLSWALTVLRSRATAR